VAEAAAPSADLDGDGLAALRRERIVVVAEAGPDVAPSVRVPSRVQGKVRWVDNGAVVLGEETRQPQEHSGVSGRQSQS